MAILNSDTHNYMGVRSGMNENIFCYYRVMDDNLSGPTNILMEYVGRICLAVNLNQNNIDKLYRGLDIFCAIYEIEILTTKIIFYIFLFFTITFRIIPPQDASCDLPGASHFSQNGRLAGRRTQNHPLFC